MGVGGRERREWVGGAASSPSPPPLPPLRPFHEKDATKDPNSRRGWREEQMIGSEQCPSFLILFFFSAANSCQDQWPRYLELSKESTIAAPEATGHGLQQTHDAGRLFGEDGDDGDFNPRLKQGDDDSLQLWWTRNLLCFHCHLCFINEFILLPRSKK